MKCFHIHPSSVICIRSLKQALIPLQQESRLRSQEPQGLARGPSPPPHSPALGQHIEKVSPLELKLPPLSQTASVICFYFWEFIRSRGVPS